MVFFQPFIHRFPKPKPTISFEEITKTIPYPSLLSLLPPDNGEVGSSACFHALDRNPTFIADNHPKSVRWTIPRNQKNLSTFLGFHLGHCRSIHGLVETQTQFCIETPDENKQIFQDVEKICRVLSNHPNSIIESSLNDLAIHVSPQVVEEVLKKLSNAGILALLFFRWAEKRDGFKYTTESFHALIEALGKIKQFRLIWNLVDTMKHAGLLTRETFTLITRRYARARKIKDAIEAFESMPKYGLEPKLSDFNWLIDTLSKSKHVSRAHEIFDKMKNKRFSPDLKTYTILLEGWGHERNLLKLMDVYLEMKDEGLEPDVVTYGILMNAYCKAQKYDEAVNLYREMVAKTCCPTPHIYCTLINGLGSVHRLDEALKFFELSKASGFTPEIPTYNAVVGSYCWALQFENAYKIVDEMKKCGVGPNSRTYDVIIRHLIKALRTKEAYAVFQKMSGEIGCEPNLNTYTMMISMFCAEGRVDMAMNVWKQMNEKGVLPCMHMFSALINGLCDENMLDEACKYFQEMLDMGIRPPGQLFGNLKAALLDAGKKDLVLNFAEKLERLRKTPLDG